MVQLIKKRYIYWDLKDDGSGERKAKLAGRPITKLNIYGFFELTSKTCVSEHKRIDIGRCHLEKVPSNRLRSSNGCIKIDPEIMSLRDILSKKNNPLNEFKITGRLCMEKWEELQQKVQSSRLRTGRQPWDVQKQSLIIQLTQSAPDVTLTLKRLRLL